MASELEANWEIISLEWSEVREKLGYLAPRRNKRRERYVATYLNEKFKGLGPKQSRNLLQMLGLTRYEIPLDSRITQWLNDFGFPITLGAAALADKYFYEFVLDSVQELCDRASVYPCILDAAIFASFDDGGWEKAKIVY
jgi:hypothetical protein